MKECGGRELQDEQDDFYVCLLQMFNVVTHNVDSIARACAYAKLVNLTFCTILLPLIQSL